MPCRACQRGLFAKHLPESSQPSFRRLGEPVIGLLMLNSRLFTPPNLRPVGTLFSFSQSRCLQISRGSERRGPARRPRPPKLSLFEELFPEETWKNGDSDRPVEQKAQDVPRLPLPEIEGFFEEFQDDLDRSRAQPHKGTNKAAADAFRQQKLAVLALQIGSKSLVESDFRRIAPKGKHIEHWTGPGDITKVIPARDPQTLEPAGFYYILFPNPAYARSYQNHVLRLHRMSTTYTPTSVESPLPLQPGVVIEGEDAYTLLQDYALLPPSQVMQIKLLYPSYGPNMKHLLQSRGYSQLVEGNDKTARSVLFWVDGQQLTTSVIKNTMAADGRERGLAWDLSIEKLDTSSPAKDEIEEARVVDYDGSSEPKIQRSAPPRWLLSFAEENEARSFVRAWHRRPFPMARGDGPRFSNAEFVW